MDGVLKSLLGGTGGGTPGTGPLNDPKFANQAKELFKMLDDLSENDPAAYKQFLADQAKAAGMPIPGSDPEPPKAAAIILKAQIETSRPDNVLADKSGKVDVHRIVTPADNSGVPVAAVIAFFSSDKVAAARNQTGLLSSDSDPATLKALKIDIQERRAPFKVQAKDGARREVFELDVHPTVIACAALDRPTDTKRYLVEHACRHVEGKRGYKLSRTLRTLQISRAELDPAFVRQADAERSHRNAEESSMQASVEGLPVGVYQKIAGMSGLSSSVGTASHASWNSDPRSKGPLIQEIPSTGLSSEHKISNISYEKSDTHVDVGTRPASHDGVKSCATTRISGPKVVACHDASDSLDAMTYTVMYVTSASGTAELQLRVLLPNDVEFDSLDVSGSEESVVVSVPGYQPVAVSEAGYDYGKVVASFKRKARTLIVRCPSALSPL